MFCNFSEDDVQVICYIGGLYVVGFGGILVVGIQEQIWNGLEVWIWQLMEVFMDEVCVVVVDDVVDMVDIFVVFLEFDGYLVWMVSNGMQVLEVIEDYWFYCVLLDIDMLGMGGCELFDCLCELYGDEVVLIVVIGWGDFGDWVFDIFLCFDYYICKFFDFGLLCKVLLFVMV